MNPETIDTMSPIGSHVSSSESLENSIKDFTFAHLLRVLTSIFPDGVIGGSIMFDAFGLLNRRPNDIDFFVPDTTEIPDYLSRYADNSRLGSETIIDINGEKIKRISLTVFDVPVCLFFVPLSQCRPINMSTRYNMTLPMQQPAYGIAAKKVYAAKSPKHAQDYEEIMSKFFPDNPIK